MNPPSRSAHRFLGSGIIAVSASTMILLGILLFPPDLPEFSPEETPWNWRDSLGARDGLSNEEISSYPRYATEPETSAPANLTVIELPSDNAHVFQDHVRGLLPAPDQSADAAVEELAAIIADESQPPRLRAAAAQALSEIDTTAARALAQDSARDPKRSLTARGAVRGIAARDDSAGAIFLNDLLFDKNVPETVRMEAAAGLARMSSPKALQTLLRATYSDVDSDASEPVFHEVLRGLARENHEGTSDFVEGLLRHPEIGADSKIAAIEAMVSANGHNIIPTLLEHAVHENPEIREAAIWAISGHDDVHLAQEGLWEIFEYEAVPLVRANIYEALRTQPTVDTDRVWNRVMNEESVAIRLAGMNLLADHLSERAVGSFDAEVVPELHRIAREDPSLSNRISAIAALGRANHSDQAARALDRLRDSSLDSETRRAIDLAIQP